MNCCDANNSSSVAISEVDPRQEKLLSALKMADHFLMKKYIPQLSTYNVVPIDDSLKETQVSSFSRLFKVERIVYDKRENNQDKLLNVYHSLYSCNGSVILVMDSDGTKVDFYLGTKSLSTPVFLCNSVLTKSLKGNFP